MSNYILGIISHGSLQANDGAAQEMIDRFRSSGDIAAEGTDYRWHICKNGDGILLRGNAPDSVLEDVEIPADDPVVLKPAFSTSIVSMLTELLRRAQAGEINQVALVYTEAGDDSRYGTWISDRGPGSTLLLIGAIADLQHTVLVLHNEQQGR